MAREQLLVNAAPHIFDRPTTGTIMRDVLIALVPAALASVLFFGARALVVVLVSVVACVAAEWVFQKICRRSANITDNSAVVTGVLLAFCLPASLPLYMVFTGAVFAIVVTKMVFGGLGHNIFNPALAGRAFLLASWPQAMTTWPAPRMLDAESVAAVTAATPLAGLKEGVFSAGYLDLFWGRVAGSLGETSAAALLLGGAYLLVRGVIKPAIPLAFIGSVGVISWLLGVDPLYSVLSGGVLLGAFFMATDYVTSPLAVQGQLIFGLGCGLITVMIRKFGGYPEGVCYAILFMNGLTPLLDRWTGARPFGE